ncbi:hypothetical protein CWIS_15545 [Cellulomonas sp. A375-1]|nr:hypothetical protein CWIS_15545 [Cellulomonas sp. A375-1]
MRAGCPRRGAGRLPSGGALPTRRECGRVGSLRYPCRRSVRGARRRRGRRSRCACSPCCGSGSTPRPRSARAAAGRTSDRP